MPHTFPVEAECLTNGCTVVVMRWTVTDPRFCADCRKAYGRNRHSLLGTTRGEHLGGTRRVGDRFAARLRDGFALMDGGADDLGDEPGYGFGV